MALNGDSGGRKRKPRSTRVLGPSPSPHPPRAPGLHVCPICSSGLVQALDWAARDGGRWEVERRCPECAWEGIETVDRGALDRFDAILDEGEASLREDLRMLERSNLEQQIEVFVEALRTDLVLPEDF